MKIKIFTKKDIYLAVKEKYPDMNADSWHLIIYNQGVCDDYGYGFFHDNTHEYGFVIKSDLNIIINHIEPVKLSDCCKAKVAERGDNHKGGTYHYACTKCDKDCNIWKKKIKTKCKHNENGYCKMSEYGTDKCNFEDDITRCIYNGG